MEPVKVLTWLWHTEGYRSKFEAEDVNRFGRMLARHSTVPYELLCLTDTPQGLHSSIRPMELPDNPVPAYGGGNAPNCFRRLATFGEEMTEKLGPRWVWSDIDAIIVRNIDHILTVKADFKIWRPDGGRSKCNGSLVAHRAGTRTPLWSAFKPAEVGTVEEFQAKTQHLGSDQAWIGSQLQPDDEFFEAKDGVYAFRSVRNAKRERFIAETKRPQRRRYMSPVVKEHDCARRERRALRNLNARDLERVETKLPPNAAIVYFPGSHKPGDRDLQEIYPWIEEHYR